MFQYKIYWDHIGYFLIKTLLFRESYSLHALSRKSIRHERIIADRITSCPYYKLKVNKIQEVFEEPLYCARNFHTTSFLCINKYIVHK